MVRDIENPSIVRTVYSGIFRHIQGYSAVLSHVQPYWGTLRYIQALLRHIEPYSDIFRNTSNPCIFDRAIFRTLTHLEIEASAKAC